ncbi:hypothetical protein BDW42DRAFT_160024 [Aspergillus taichungensis]|uniref:Uncharacterized protein n=1 Tax=Aspergillus taichungensis TaxID=482145 RepID=A0A2J5I740_9EURO|nr:hypothetical protein BDW42DRAFT_160024 [Aspergillus taichungensis]
MRLRQPRPAMLVLRTQDGYHPRQTNAIELASPPINDAAGSPLRWDHPRSIRLPWRSSQNNQDGRPREVDQETRHFGSVSFFFFFLFLRCSFFINMFILFSL